MAKKKSPSSVRDSSQYSNFSKSPYKKKKSMVNYNCDLPSLGHQDSLPEYMSAEEFIENMKSQQGMTEEVHPGNFSNIHIPGSLSPVYKVDEKKYNNVDFEDLNYDGEEKVIKLFQIDEDESALDSVNIGMTNNK